MYLNNLGNIATVFNVGCSNVFKKGIAQTPFVNTGSTTIRYDDSRTASSTDQENFE